MEPIVDTPNDPIPAFEAVASDTERRGSSGAAVVLDRRRGPTPMFSRYTFFGGRRQNARREGEAVNRFYDKHGQGLFFLACAIILLNTLDAFFTLLFLGHGGEELNPVAAWFLELGPEVFLAVKTIGIGVCTAYLVMVCRFRGVIWGIVFVVAIYSALLVWHLVLYQRVPA